jgi:formylglycine-generating enzyme required for sulfatase activity
MVRWIATAAMVAVGSVALLSVGCTPVQRPGQKAAKEREVGLPKEVRVPKDGSTLLVVPGGEFVMGDPEHTRRVMLSAYYIDKYEVSNEQYAKFLADVKEKGDAAWRHPDQPKTKKDHTPSYWDHPELGIAKADHPVVGVDWFDAYAYAQWAGKRLPTEAEWERAARGTDECTYPWGNQPPEERLTSRANFFGSSYAADGYQYTAPVTAFKEWASPVGCLNMAGNAAEWCADWNGPLTRERAANPKGPETGTVRVVRGGSWNLGAAHIRCYSRSAMAPSHHDISVGFRCAKDALPEPPAPK